MNGLITAAIVIAGIYGTLGLINAVLAFFALKHANSWRGRLVLAIFVLFCWPILALAIAEAESAEDLLESVLDYCERF